MVGVGHNSGDARVQFKVKVLNSLSRALPGGYHGVGYELPAGASVGDLLDEIGIARAQVHLVIVNGTDITPGDPSAPVRVDYCIQPGDVVALSGPVPYSWGYGSPVV